jgi:hypothetical protein
VAAKDIGKLLADAMEKIGKEGVIPVEEEWRSRVHPTERVLEMGCPPESAPDLKSELGPLEPPEDHGLLLRTAERPAASADRSTVPER